MFKVRQVLLTIFVDDAPTTLSIILQKFSES